MSWITRIPGTFGNMDLIFCSHPLDAERAFELLQECYKSNVPLADVLTEVENFLSSKGAKKVHIREQATNVKEKFNGWLS